MSDVLGASVMEVERPKQASDGMSTIEEQIEN